MPTTYGYDTAYCRKSHCGVRGYCRQKWVLQVQIICKFSNERTCKRNKDVQGLSCGFEVKQNFPLRYFYGESANAIKIQIWITLIANLLITLVKNKIKRPWSFSGLATMIRILLMSYVSIQSFFEQPHRDWDRLITQVKAPPEELSLF